MHARVMLPEPTHRDCRVHHGDTLSNQSLIRPRLCEIESPYAIVAPRVRIVVCEVDELPLRMGENLRMLTEIALQGRRPCFRRPDDHQIDFRKARLWLSARQAHGMAAIQQLSRDRAGIARAAGIITRNSYR